MGRNASKCEDWNEGCEIEAEKRPSKVERMDELREGLSKVQARVGGIVRSPKSPKKIQKSNRASKKSDIEAKTKSKHSDSFEGKEKTKGASNYTKKNVSEDVVKRGEELESEGSRRKLKSKEKLAGKSYDRSKIRSR